MLALAALALAAAPQICDSPFNYKFSAHGTLQGVNAPLPTPLAGAANGDPVTLSLELEFSDAICTTLAGLDSPFGITECAELTVGPVTTGQNPMSFPCVWGEGYQTSPVFGVDVVDVDMPIEASALTLRMRLRDPNLAVGIGILDGSAVNSFPLTVPAVTDPGFSATMDIVDFTGAVLGVVDLALLELDEPVVGGGLQFCLSNPNSTGFTGVTGALGSALVSDNDVTLSAAWIPQQSFGFFLCSELPAFIPMPGGSAGNLCLGGMIGRFVRPGEIQFSGPNDFVSLTVDLNDFPQPTGSAAVASGDTWFVQYWFRDASPAGPTSNFTSGIALSFL